MAEQIKELAARLRTNGFRWDFSNSEIRLLCRLWPALAGGNRITGRRLTRLAVELDVSRDFVNSFVNRTGERDRRGEIVGIMGLSQVRHSHRFRVQGRDLWTWCALDALFLPTVLNEKVEIESTCPATGSRMQIRVGPQGIESTNSCDGALTIPHQKCDIDSGNSGEQLRSRFCCLVNFFASREAALDWTCSHECEFSVISIEAGFRLGEVMLSGLLNGGVKSGLRSC